MPDNQLAEETITGTYEGKEPLRSGSGSRLFIKDDNFATSPYNTGITVWDNQAALMEQVTNDLEPGMKVSLRFSVKQGQQGKQRNLLEILNRFSDPTPPVAQPTGTQVPTQAPQPSGGYIPSPADQWRADGQERGNSITNATTLIGLHYSKEGTIPTHEWIDEAVDAIHYASETIRSGKVVTPEIVEELDEEDNPF